MARLRLLLAFAAAAPAWLAVPRHAAADPTMMCTGALKINMGLVTRDKNGAVNQIAPADASFMINNGECLADPAEPKLSIEIRVTSGLPQGMQETFEVWVGSGCSDVINRNGTTNSCEQITTPLTLSQFWNNAPGGLIYQDIPVRALESPVTHFCDPNGAPTNNVWFIFYTDRNMPDNICSIALPSRLSAPTPVSNVIAGSGDGAVQVTWVIPTAGNLPRKFQILCADMAGKPVKQGQILHQFYTTSTAGGIQRKTFASGGTSGDTDGGILGTDDAGLATEPNPSSATGGPATGAGGGAGGSDDNTQQAAPDAGTPAGVQLTPGIGPFTNLNHDFICSEPIEGSNTARIDGLTNGVTYQFTVLAIDDFGNPAFPVNAVDQVVIGTPEPVEDLYRRFRDEGGKPQGFCFIATAAYGSYESPAVRVLRRFRDEVLLPTETGRAFVGWYYHVSPPAAAYIATHPAAREEVRALLMPLVGVASVHLWLGGWCEALGLALLVSLLFRRRLRGAVARALSSRSAA